MTADRLAALLHDAGIIAPDGDQETHCRVVATRLAAAGVTVAPQPAPDAHRHDENDCRDCQHIWRLGYATCAEHPVTPQPAPDAQPVCMDDYMAGYRQAKSDAAALAATMPPDTLRAAAQALVTATDALTEWDEHNGYVVNSHRDRLDHDVDAAWDALRAALGDEP